MNGMNLPLGYQGQGAEQTTMAQMPTMKQRLDLAVKQAEERLARAVEAKALLERNPDLERLLDIMQQGVF